MDEEDLDHFYDNIGTPESDYGADYEEELAAMGQYGGPEPDQGEFYRLARCELERMGAVRRHATNRL
jgi:hypothetical protein